MSSRSLALAMSTLAAAALPLAAQAAGAATCTALKTADYVGVQPLSPDAPGRVQTFHIDADTLTVTFPTFSFPLTPAAEACAFTTPDGDAVVVSKAGVLLVNQTSNGDFALAQPVQLVKIKQLVGTWNFVNQQLEADGIRHTYNGMLKVDAKGGVQLAACDAKGGNCNPPAAVNKLKVNPAGGFDLTDADGLQTRRIFVNRNKLGQMMLMAVGLDSTSLVVATPKVARTLPAVGDKHSQWDLQVPATGVPGALTISSFKVLTVDPATGTFTRKRAEDCRVDSWVINTGRDGMNYRKAAPFTRCDGTTGNYADNLSLGLRDGFGIGAHGWEAAGKSYFGLAVDRP